MKSSDFSKRCLAYIEFHFPYSLFVYFSFVLSNIRKFS